jgi:hypothetical protein
MTPAPGAPPTADSSCVRGGLYVLLVWLDHKPVSCLSARMSVMERNPLRLALGGLCAV